MKYNVFKRKFTNKNPNWDSNEVLVDLFIKMQLQLANDLMEYRGYIFLRDLLDGLGFEATAESCTHGWFKGIDNDEDFVHLSWIRINGTEDYELIFKCYPILDYLPVENVAAAK